MNRSLSISIVTLAGAVLVAGTTVDEAGSASFSPMNMMNPSRWFGGDDDYYGPGHGEVPYGAPGFWAPGYGAPPAYGGYGAPPPPPQGGYVPGYQAPRQAPAEDPSAARIRELEERIRQLESSQSAEPPYSGSARPYEAPGQWTGQGGSPYAPGGQSGSPQGSEPYPPAGQSWTPQASEPYPPADPSWSPRGSEPYPPAGQAGTSQGTEPYPSGGRAWSPQQSESYPAPYAPAGDAYAPQQDLPAPGGYQPSHTFQSYGPD